MTRPISFLVLCSLNFKFIENLSICLSLCVRVCIYVSLSLSLCHTHTHAHTHASKQANSHTNTHTGPLLLRVAKGAADNTTDWFIYEYKHGGWNIHVPYACVYVYMHIPFSFLARLMGMERWAREYWIVQYAFQEVYLCVYSIWASVNKAFNTISLG